MATQQYPTTTKTDTAADHAENLKETAVETADQIRTAASEQLDRLESSIRRNPMAAAGIAAGVGFLLALIARR